jgi:hypothetical protein
MRNTGSVIDIFCSQLYLISFLKVFAQFLSTDPNVGEISSIFPANRFLASGNLLWERDLIGEFKCLGMTLSKPIPLLKDLRGQPHASALVWEASAKLILLGASC